MCAPMEELVGRWFCLEGKITEGEQEMMGGVAAVKEEHEHGTLVAMGRSTCGWHPWNINKRTVPHQTAEGRGALLHWLRGVESFLAYETKVAFKCSCL